MKWMFATVVVSVVSILSVVGCGSDDKSGSGGSGGNGGEPVTSAASGTGGAGGAGGQGGAGGAASACDNSGDCMKCQQCAQGDACKQQAMACLANPACQALNMCLVACMDAACQQNCLMMNQAGVADYNAAGLCIICQTCPNDCAQQAAGCP